MITRDFLKKLDDFRTVKVEVPEWKDFVYVRTLTGLERDAFETSMYTGRGKDRRENLKNLRARLVVLTVCDEKGVRLFTNEDAEWIGKKNANALDRIFIKAQELAGLRQEDIEDLTKNSESTQNEKSILESPKN